MLRADNNMGVSVHSHMSKPLDIYMRERERERERERDVRLNVNSWLKNLYVENFKYMSLLEKFK